MQIIELKAKELFRQAREQSLGDLVAEMTAGIESVILEERKDGIIPRFNQAKSVACLHATFRVHEDIPGSLRHGLFVRPATYPAYLRFANASQQDDSLKDVRGLSIRVQEVEGSVLWGEPGCQDFLLNSYPALFVSTPEEFLDFIHARKSRRELSFFFNPFNAHLKAFLIALKSRQHHLSPLDIRYFSTVPFRLGENKSMAVKYSVTPHSSYRTQEPVEPGRNQLRAAIKAHLAREPASFVFGVQKLTNSKTMPIEDASVIWDEQESPFIPVATITIENQPFDSPEALAECERCSFNPWQSLAAHEPLGRMNAVRRLVYAHGANVRRGEV